MADLKYITRGKTPLNVSPSSCISNMANVDRDDLKGFAYISKSSSTNYMIYYVPSTGASTYLYLDSDMQSASNIKIANSVKMDTSTNKTNIVIYILYNNKIAKYTFELWNLEYYLYYVETGSGSCFPNEITNFSQSLPITISSYSNVEIVDDGTNSSKEHLILWNYNSSSAYLFKSINIGSTLTYSTFSIPGYSSSVSGYCEKPFIRLINGRFLFVYNYTPTDLIGGSTTYRVYGAIISNESIEFTSNYLTNISINRNSGYALSVIYLNSSNTKLLFFDYYNCKIVEFVITLSYSSSGYRINGSNSEYTINKLVGAVSNTFEYVKPWAISNSYENKTYLVGYTENLSSSTISNFAALCIEVLSGKAISKVIYGRKSVVDLTNGKLEGPLFAGDNVQLSNGETLFGTELLNEVTLSDENRNYTSFTYLPYHKFSTSGYAYKNKPTGRILFTLFQSASRSSTSWTRVSLIDSFSDDNSYTTSFVDENFGSINSDGNVVVSRPCTAYLSGYAPRGQTSSGGAVYCGIGFYLNGTVVDGARVSGSSSTASPSFKKVAVNLVAGDVISIYTKVSTTTQGYCRATCNITTD